MKLVGIRQHHAYMNTYIHTYTHTYIHTHIYEYIHTHIHEYIHTHIHTYMETQTYSDEWNIKGTVSLFYEITVTKAGTETEDRYMNQ